MHSINRQSRARKLLTAASIGFVGSAAFAIIEIYCRYRAYRYDGDRGWLWVPIVPFAALFLGLGLLLAFSLFALLSDRLRSTAQAGLLCCFAGFVGCVTLPHGNWFRDDGMRTIAMNGAPVIQAINAFYLRRNQFPERLQVLVPEYLPAVPGTGLSAYPAFEYVVGAAAQANYSGNPWVLRVPTPTGVLNWDLFLYYPLQNYPNYDHGGSLERIGAWAYVHE